MGSGAVRRYEGQLDRTILQAREFPESGRPRPDIMPHCRRPRAGHRHVYYTFSDDAVTIHRILHERRHVTPSLLAEPEE